MNYQTYIIGCGKSNSHIFFMYTIDTYINSMKQLHFCIILVIEADIIPSSEGQKYHFTKII